MSHNDDYKPPGTTDVFYQVMNPISINEPAGLLIFRGEPLRAALQAREYALDVHDMIVDELLTSPAYFGRSGQAELDADLDPRFVQALASFRETLLHLLASAPEVTTSHPWYALLYSVPNDWPLRRFSVDHLARTGTLDLSELFSGV